MVELKARVDNYSILRTKLTALGAKYIGTFEQKDLYFVVPEGRLKLRTVKDKDSAELIYYERENVKGPKSDEAYIIKVQESGDLSYILQKILKPYIIIEKDREIYRYKGNVLSSKYNTIQIHLDSVKNLGAFLELEMESSYKTSKADKLFLQNFAKKIGITEQQLEKMSYSDLMSCQ
jgi:predicted adenylyl cyclase CyaB